MDSYSLVVASRGPKFAKKQTSGTSDDPAALTMNPGRGGSLTMRLNGVSATRGPDGLRVETSSVGALATYLSNLLRLPVVDKTNLAGEYGVAMEIPNLDPATAAEDRLNARDESIIAAVDILGLKLVRQKNPVETIIVDSVNKGPTEN